MTRRTPTPTIDTIWDRTNTTHRWHQQWLAHLEEQTRQNPNHPGQDHPTDYRNTADWATRNPDSWQAETDRIETQTRHDLQAELTHLNQAAGHDTIHHGLTSHDIVDPATQYAITSSMWIILGDAIALARYLAGQAENYARQRIVARTHGQPAQLTTYGHRIATILGPLTDWIERTISVTNGYQYRPPYGAVGTAADLHRTIHGWDNPQPVDFGRYIQAIAPYNMGVTRQTYHRSYDLPIANAIVELSTIAHTWATDRRLEALLGLGNETRTPGQTGSSAMAHKTNPVLAERICSLTVLARSHYTAMAELATQNWLEGDVATSAARRELLPAMFANAHAIILNWAEAATRWTINIDAMTAEVDRYSVEICTGAALQWLVEHGIGRGEAHTAIRNTPITDWSCWQRELLAGLELHTPGNRESLDRAMQMVLVGPIGDVQQQIELVVQEVWELR